MVTIWTDFDPAWLLNSDADTMTPWQSMMARPIDLDSHCWDRDDHPRRVLPPRLLGISAMPGHYAAPDAGIAEWRERQRQQDEARALGLDPDASYVAIAPDRDSPAPPDYDSRPQCVCECGCGKTRPRPARGPAPRFFDDTCRKRAARRRDMLAQMDADGFHLPDGGSHEIPPDAKRLAHCRRPPLAAQT